MSNNTNKILANLIKADLQDFLNNEKRLEKGWYFFPYNDMSGKIWVIKDRGKGVIISPEIENLVRENALANAIAAVKKNMRNYGRRRLKGIKKEE